MKRIITATAATIAALTLSGCTGGTLGPAGGSAPADKRPTASQSAPAPTTPEPRTEAEVKASASAAGRPPAAFDAECEVWEQSPAHTPEQQWARDIGATFLEAKDAECPDQIMSPYYFIESFRTNATGELLVSLDPELDAQMWGPNGQIHGLDTIALGIMSSVMEDYPDLEQVTVYIPEENRHGLATREGAKQAKYEGRV